MREKQIEEMAEAIFHNYCANCGAKMELGGKKDES